MVRSDTYSLKYEVTVDAAEEGFDYNTEYPANGNTDLNYTDENGDEKTSEIKVPSVEVEMEEPEDIFVNFNSGDASNISFMLIDAEGNVEFVEKVDIGDETSFQIPVEIGKVSAVFVKQSTSGMFWFSEETEYVQNVIDCLVENNPSYKGHNAVCFGGGEHTLEFKEGKFVTYTFTGAELACDCRTVEEPEVVEE